MKEALVPYLKLYELPLYDCFCSLHLGLARLKTALDPFSFAALVREALVAALVGSLLQAGHAVESRVGKRDGMRVV